VKLIKDEIMNKGSVIAYVKADKIMAYEFNGKKVQNLCGDKTPDHAVNIIGYGNYINDEHQKKSYWIVRNSWGKHWGDKGHFKVDMYGPSTCEDNFIHTVVVFNINMPKSKKSPVKITFPLYNYYLKYSPDFYHNLYYKNFDSQKGKADQAENKKSYLYGQEESTSEQLPSSLSSPLSSSLSSSSSSSSSSPLLSLLSSPSTKLSSSSP
ncbi:hypothetical protein K1I93_09580, partial [Streptococcus australis]|nr:hypothetical protein [Streptococcus australis]